MSVTDAPLLVIAGAGSGKTRVIVYKVAYLIESGVRPENILLLSFTRRAADEMLGRVQTLLSNQLMGVRGGTFHSFANRILRIHGSIITVPPSFTIIDTQDAADIIGRLKGGMSIEKKRFTFPKKEKVREIISRARNIGISVPDTVKEYFPEVTDFTEEIRNIGDAFKTYKTNYNLFDYDDLLETVRNGLKNNEIFRERVRASISYVLIDEYQDTNNTQREIVELLVGDRTGVTVVGDDAQSIYSFRGANYENILRFPESFPHCKYVKIEENYRSGQEVLDFANSVISNANRGFQKTLRAQRHTGKKPMVKTFSDESEEAGYIADRIMAAKGNGLRYSDCAVLIRAAWHSNYIQAELMRHDIPFIVVGGIKFSERKHIKDIIAFLKIVLNPLDAPAWHRILHLTKGVGRVRADEIIDVIKTRSGTIDFLEFADRRYYSDLRTYEIFYRDAGNNPPAQVIERILSFYTEILEQTEEDYEVRLKDIKTLIGIADTYTDLEKFLSEFTLEPPLKQHRSERTSTIGVETKKECVVISTIHSAKGLEWHTVFIPFALDGLIPSVKSLHSPEEEEEERRLFYVAISRAKEILYVTMPESVSSWNTLFIRPSRFISEVDAQWYETE